MTTLAHALMPISDAGLVTRFWKLIAEVSDYYGAETKALTEFARTGELEALEREALGCAGALEELAACVRELRKRGLDPRKWYEET